MSLAGSRVVLVVNEGRPRAVELAGVAAEWLRARGYEVVLPERDAGASGMGHLGAEPEIVERDAVLVLALGGDGTVLRAVSLAAPQGAPVLGVNLGRLGYLSVLEPDDLRLALERFDAGDYGMDERSMLAAQVDGDTGPTHLALNEAVVEKLQPGHTVHLAVSIGGHFFTNYVADALIFGTPTGSTAYSYSAGGPIVSPRLAALLVTPVAAHTPLTHSLVLPHDDVVRVEVLDPRGAALALDGRQAACLAQGATVNVARAPARARFVTFGERDFLAVLKAKFGLSDR